MAVVDETNVNTVSALYHDYEETVMSLAELFYARNPRGLTRFAGKAQKPRQAPTGMVFEPIEPRILLDATPFAVDMAALGEELVVRVQQDGDTPLVQIFDTATDTVVASRSLLDTSEVIVWGTDAQNTLMIDGTVLSTLGVTFYGGGSDDVLTLHSGMSDALDGLFVSPNLGVTFVGGGGSDRLVSDAAHNEWFVDGADSGRVSGPGTFNFVGVEYLEGAEGNEDTFVFQAGGSLSGGVDGGLGGFDTLEIEGGTYASATFAASGPDSGTIDLDGNLIRYAGLEPLLLNSSGISELVIDATIFGDNLVLGRNPDNPGQWRVTNEDPLLGTMEEILFSAPATSLTIQLGAGNDRLTVQEFATGIGTSLIVEGGGGNDTVVIDENALVSTRVIAGADHLNGVSTGDSGDIDITAETIEVKSGAKVLAHVVPDSPVSSWEAGDITFTAEDTPFNIPTPFIDVINTKSSITIDDATVRGGAVVVESRALADRTWDELGPGFDVVLEFLDSLSEFGGVAIANAEATISLTGTTSIDAGSLKLASKATGDAEVRTVGVALAVAYGSSKPTAEVTVGTGVTITTIGDVTVESDAESHVNVEAKQSLLGPNKPATAFDTTIAVGHAALISKVVVQDDAMLTVGGNLNVRATQLKEHDVSSAAGAYEDGSVGTAFAISTSDSTVEALLDGNATVGGNVTVSADSVIVYNDTSAVAQVGTGILGGLGIAAKDKVGLANATGSFFQQISPPPDKRGEGPTKFALSAAVAWADHDNLSTARIGPGAIVSAQGDHGLSVESKIVDKPEISARAFVDSQKISDTTPGGNTKENSASTAFVRGNYDNHSQAYIGQNAQVDAAHGVSVDSQTSIPLVIDWLRFAPPEGSSAGEIEEFVTELASSLGDHANSNFGLQNGLFTSWAQSNATGTKTALGFSVNIMNLTNTSQAFIAEGAKINQKTALDGTDLRTGDQDVRVQAVNLVEAVHLAGVFGLKFLGTSGGEGAVGGSYLEIDYGGTVTAQIHSGAQVYADSLLVRADSKTHNFSLAEAGGKADDLAINGAFSLVRENNRTLARIDDGAVINTGIKNLELPRVVRDRYTPGSVGLEAPFLFGDAVVEDTVLALDSNGDGRLTADDHDIVSVDSGTDPDDESDDIFLTNLNQLVVAEDESTLINISGGVVKGQSIGVGFSVGINEIDRKTEGLIGNRAEAFDSAAVDGAEDTITFGGPHGYVTGEQVVYDPDGGTAIAPAGTYYVIVLDPRTIKLAQTREDALADTPAAVDLTEPVSGGEIHWLRSGEDATGSVNAGGRGKVAAVNEGAISAWSVAGSVVTNGSSTPDPEGQQAPKKAGKYGFGLSLNVSVNTIEDTTRASIDSAELTGFTDLAIEAKDTTDILAVAGSVAISTVQSGIGGAGAWTQNTIRTDTEASIVASEVQLTGDADITAENTGTILGISASLSGSGKAGVAGSVSVNQIDADARALVSEGSKVAVSKIAFAPGSAVLNADGSINLGGPHGLSEGDRVVYRNGGGASIGGLVNGDVYYVHVVDDTTVRLARSLSEAGDAPETYFDPASDVNVTHEPSLVPPFDDIAVEEPGALFLGYQHRYLTGDAVVYRNGGGTSVEGLTDGETYYVIRYDDRSVKLASTREEALDGLAIEHLDPSSATGTQHSVRLAVDPSPAQGTSHQLTAAGNVSVSAHNDATIHAVAGAPSFGGKTGIGASVSVNTVHNTTEALIVHSDISAANDVQIQAVTQGEIVGVTSAIGAATGPLAAAVSVSVNTITDETRASINGRLEEGVQAGGDIVVEAEESSTIFSLAGVVAGSTSGAGVGVSTSVNVVNNSVDAAITGNAIVSSSSGDVLVEAEQGPARPASGFARSVLDTFGLPLDATISSLAIGGGAASSTGGAGSISVNVVNNKTSAHIGDKRDDLTAGEQARVSAFGDIDVWASDDAVISAIAGNVSGGGTAGIGIASTTIVTNNTVEAYVGVDAVLDARGQGDRSSGDHRGISIAALSTEDMRIWAVAGAGAGNIGGTGSATVTVLNEETSAFVDRGARLNQSSPGSEMQDVVLQASDITTLFGLAGALAVGGSAGIGAGADVPVIHKTTEAWIASSVIVSAGGDVLVDAESMEDLTSISASIAGGGSAGIAGSASVPVLDIRTRSFIGPDKDETIPALSDTLVTFENNFGLPLLHDSIRRSHGSWLDDGFAPGQSITVAGTNGHDGTYEILEISPDGRTIILNFGEDIAFEQVLARDIQITSDAGSGNAGAVLSADGNINFTGNGAGADAISRETGNWHTDGFEAGQWIAVSGSNMNDGVYRIADISDDGLTMTLVDDAVLSDEVIAQADLDIMLTQTVVKAEGSVAVSAENHTELDLIAGNITGGGSGNVGASATVPVVTKVTEAFIGRDAIVDAKANRAAIEVNTGGFSIASENRAFDITDVPAPLFFVDGTLSADVNFDGTDDLTDPSFTQQRTATPETAMMKGVMVGAVNRDDIETVAISGGGSGGLAISIGGSVNVHATETSAYVAHGAQINGDRAGAGDEQSVLVAAGSDYSHMGLALVAGGSGSFAATPGADVTVLHNRTTAYIDDRTDVWAMKDVVVSAKSIADILSVSAGVAVSGVVSVGGAVSVIDVDSRTHAYIGQDANSQDKGARVWAGGNVLVSAGDETDIDVVTGSAGVGIGGGGLGASVAVTTIHKDTQAFIGDHADVSALGNGPFLTGMLNGELAEAGAAVEPEFYGVAVQAQSSENVFSLAATVGGGFYAGIAGAVTVEVIDSDTAAFIGANALINGDTPDAGAEQSVNVSAYNDAQVFTFAGGIGGGFVGISGAVDVGTLRNDTSAYIGPNAEVHARKDVDVNALSRKNIESVTVSAAGGVVGGAGSVSVWAVGTEFESSYSDGSESEDALVPAGEAEGNSEEPQYANVQAFADAMAGGGNAGGGYTSVLNGYAGPVFDPAVAVNGDLDTVDLGSDHHFDTGDAVIYRAGSGNAVGGLMEGEQYYVIATDNPDVVQLALSLDDALNGVAIDLDPTQASGESHTLQSVTADTTSSASGDIEESAPEGEVAASTGSTDISVGTTAFIGADATVSAGDDVNIRAADDVTGGFFAGGVSAGVGALGGSVVVVNLRSHTDAHIAAGATVTAGGEIGDEILVSAILTEHVTGKAFAGQLAAVTLGAQVVVINDTSEQMAYLDDDVTILGAETIIVSAGATQVVEADSTGGGVAGLALGWAHASVDIGGGTYAYIAGAAISGNHTVDIDVTASSDIQASAVAAAVSGGITFGASGVHASATVDPTVRAFIGDGAVIEVTGDVDIDAIVKADAAADAFGVSVGVASYSIGESEAITVVTPAVAAFIANAMLTLGGDLRLQAMHNLASDRSAATGTGGKRLGARSKANASGGGSFAGINGSSADADNSAIVKAFLDARSGIDTLGDVRLFAGSSGEANSEANGFTLSLVAGVGKSEATADANGSTSAFIGTNPFDAGAVPQESQKTFSVGGDLDIEASSANSAAAQATAPGGGLVGVLGADVHAIVSPTVSSYIDNGLLVDAAGDVSLASRSEGDADAVASNFTLGLIVSVGGATTEAKVTPDIDTYVGTGTSIMAGGHIELLSLHNYHPDGSVATINDDGVVRDKGAIADSTASGGGIVGVSPATAEATADANVLTAVKTGAALLAGGGVSILSRSHNGADATADGSTGGIVAVGDMTATAHAYGTTLSKMLDVAGLTVGGDLVLFAKGTSQADSLAESANGGAVAVRHTTATSDAAPVVRATMSALTPASLNPHAILVTGNTDITALALGEVLATSDGVGGGIVDVARADAIAKWRPTVETSILSGTTLQSGGDVGLHAYNNHNEAGLNVTENLVKSDAKATGGGLVTAGPSADAHTTIDADVLARIGSGSVISAGHALNVVAKSRNNGEADARGVNGGVVSFGFPSAITNVTNHARAVTDDATPLQPTQVTAGQDIAFRSHSDNAASASATGGSGGAAAIASTMATVEVHDDQTAVRIGNYTELSAAGTIILEALKSVSAHGNADGRVVIAIQANNYSTSDVDVSLVSKIEVGEGATLSAGQVKIHAKVTSLDVDGFALSRTNALNTTSDAKSLVDVTSLTSIVVGPGAFIDGTDCIEIISRQDGVDVDSDADAKIVGFTGTVRATGHNDLDLDSNVEIRAGSTLVSDKVIIEAESQKDDSSYGQTADADAATVVQWVVNTFKVVEKITSKIPIIGWIVKWITRTVTTISRVVLNSNESSQLTGEFTSDNSINLSGDIYQGASTSPRLIINEDGSLDAIGGIQAEVVGGEVVVDDITGGQAAGIIDLRSPGGALAGTGTIHKNANFATVTIINNSDLNLRINGISSINPNPAEADLQVDVDPDKDTSAFTILSDLGSGVDSPQVLIQNNSGSDVFLAGEIKNPTGVTSIVNQGGGIFALPDASIEGHEIILETPVGQVGAAGEGVNVRLFADDSPATLDVEAGGPVYLASRLLAFGETEAPVVPGTVIDGADLRITAAGDIDVSAVQSHILIPSVDPTIDPSLVAVAGVYRLQHVFSTDGNILVSQGAGDLGVGSVEALLGMVDLTASGAVFEIGDDAEADVAGHHVTLVADGGAIGTAGNLLEIDAGATGWVTAAAQGDVYLLETVGDLRLAQIASSAGDVRLEARDGSLVDALVDDEADVVGRGITLVANYGGIGTADEAVEIDSGAFSAGLLDAQAAQGIFLVETEGDLQLGRVTATGGDVSLVAAGSILDGAQGADSNIDGDNVELRAIGGGIGTETDAVEIDSAVGLPGLVTARANHDVNVSETAGDLSLREAVSLSGSVQLSVQAGGLRDDDDGGAVDITGTSAVLHVAGDIGQSTNAMETAVGSLNGNAGGNVWIVNDGALTVQSMTAGGTISIEAHSPLTVTGNVTGTTIYLEAGDTTASDDDLTVTAGATITASAGHATLVAGDDLIIEADAVVTAELGPVILESGDDLIIGAGAVVAAEEDVNLNFGGDLFLSGTVLASSLVIEGNDDDNVIVITGLLTDTFVQTFGGNDTINVGSNATMASNSGGNMNGINAVLVIDGGNGPSTDVVSIDDSGDGSANSGQLTDMTLTGLGMSQYVDYVNIEQLDISLGGGADEFTIFSTHAGETQVHAGAGADVINVRTISGETLIDGEEDADTVNVGSVDPLPAVGGTVDGIGAELTLIGGGGIGDELNVDDRTDLDRNVGILTGGMLTGLGMAAGIGYGEFETLNIDLGAGADVMNVRGTSAVTNLRLHAGDDRVFVSSAADADLVTAATLDFLSGDLDGLQGALNIDAGEGTHRLMVSDEGSSVGDSNVVIADTVPSLPGSGLSASAEIWITGLAPAGISYEASRINGNFFDGVVVWTGSGSDHVVVDGTHRRDGGRTTTMLNTGLGNDDVTVDLNAGEDGMFVLHTMGGSLSPNPSDAADLIAAGDAGDDDTVDAAASSLPLIIFGGLGDDDITGGSGNDLIFGDFGHVEYADPVSGDRIAVQGFGGAGDLISGDLVPTSRAYSVDLPFGGADTIRGIGGADIILGGQGGDDIYGDDPAASHDSSDGADVLIGDNGEVNFVNGALADFAATDAEESTGGADTIRGNAGSDFILGGAAGDILYGNNEADSNAASDGADIVIGDNGVIKYIGGYVGADNDHATVDLVQATDPEAFVGSDTIYGHVGNDILIGGAGDDAISGATGADIILGDQGVVKFLNGLLSYVQDPFGGFGNDVLLGEEGRDIIMGGLGNDTIRGLGEADILIGDEGEVFYAINGVTITKIDTTSLNPSEGGGDTIYGGDEDDVIIGGANSDRLDGGKDEDLILGDNVLLVRNGGSGDAIGPRFRVLSETTIYDADGKVQVDPTADTAPPSERPGWVDWRITLDQSSTATRFGNDYIAGGADDDQIFGQMGHDIIQGDGSIDLRDTGGNPYDAGAYRDYTGALIVMASVEADTDGDDYIEGGSDNDVIFGNLGQDDLIGGSSNLFGLVSPEDGSDFIFGGAGIDIGRNDLGDGLHGGDSDMILGDNGNIFRLVGINGVASGPLSFNYDDAYGEQIVVRVAELLDYTPGGPDFNATDAAGDSGAADELHGESGDDFIYGMVGNDFVFGEGQDDDLIGGYGHDWMSGGLGQDGMLGDDGRIFTSRNGTAEPLYGIAATTQDFIDTPGGIQRADINVLGELKKAVDLTPFNVIAGGDELDKAHYADDIMFGGLGSDFMHGGSGDDAMSGAEALPVHYDRPFNPGDVLRFSLVTGQFAEYDEFEPLKEIFYGVGAPFAKDSPFVLNFLHTEGALVSDPILGDAYSDGDDRLFGDHGNDWLVGGSGLDNLYGGWGDDLLNADDDHTTNGGLNDMPDTHPSYEDRAFGGAGRDRLIANTGGDRLIDWAGAFNTYLTPFSEYGLATVSRMLQPSLADFLYDLSASDGVDLTLGGDPARNGEPYGELGLVRQQDPAWQDQTGAPLDVMPGNIPGGKRDVLRSANFDSTTSATGSGFFADSGSWTVQNGALRVSAESLGGDAVSVFHVGDDLPGYFEIQASISIVKPTAGWKGNAFVIFDYQNEQDFKFAGIDDAINKLVMGHRDETGWHVDEQAPVLGGVKYDTYYNMLVAINGTNVTLVVNNKDVFSHTYTPRIEDGYAYGMNYGYVGVGSDNSRGTFDNVRVQILPPQITFQYTENFQDGVADLFGADTVGNWTVSGGRYSVNPADGMATSQLDLGPDHLNVNAFLELNATVNTQGRAGFIFDRYGEESFKFVAIDVVRDQLVVGHYTAKSGWVDDAVVDTVIDAGKDYTLIISLKGTTVSAMLNGAAGGGYQAVAGYVFNAATVDGNFGLMAQSGVASFDDVKVKTDDQAFVSPEAPAALVAASAGATYEERSDLLPTSAALDDLLTEAVRRWSSDVENPMAFNRLVGVTVRLTDLPDMMLGFTDDRTIWLDSTAAGHGWFVDQTPMDDSEFRRQAKTGDLIAMANGPAAAHVDLLTVLMHEVGHQLGLDHDSSAAVMKDALDIGVRRVSSANIDNVALVVDWAESNHEALPLHLEFAAVQRQWISDFVKADRDDTLFDEDDFEPIMLDGAGASFRSRE